MKKSLLTVALLPLLALTGCMNMDHSQSVQPALNINYPAIFIVNAKGNSRSVIDLASQQVKETISFGNTSMSHSGTMPMNDMIMWPHHIYLSPDGSKPGVPGMDLNSSTGSIQPELT